MFRESKDRVVADRLQTIENKINKVTSYKFSIDKAAILLLLMEKNYPDRELLQIQDISDNSPNLIIANSLNSVLIEKILASKKTQFLGFYLFGAPRRCVQIY